MLSRRDIEKELGKGINIYPLVRENIKENSINLGSDIVISLKVKLCQKEQSILVCFKTSSFPLPLITIIILTLLFHIKGIIPDSP